MRVRTVHLAQCVRHPYTNLPLGFGPEEIKAAILAHSSIKKYAYIKHDKDVYTEADEQEDRRRLYNEFERLDSDEKVKYLYNDEHYDIERYINEHLIKKAGELKPEHYHVILKFDSTTELESIAKWFHIPSNFIDVPRGKGCFYDCLQYLTHESEKQQAMGKYRYPDEEVHANFDWRKELSEYKASKIKRGAYKDIVEECEYKVAYEGMALKEVRDHYPDVWLKKNEISILQKLRGSYLIHQPAPIYRINLYICGKGGVGKGLLSKAMARSMFPDMDDDEIFFTVGAKNVTFEGYDGQPVIIWNDFRSGEFMGRANSRGHAFDLLEPHPNKTKENVKNSSVQLLNYVNIINSVEPYEDFLDGLAGKYIDKEGIPHEAEDVNQSYRRFPIIIPIDAEKIDILLNKGIMDDTNEFGQYVLEMRFENKLKEIAVKSRNNRIVEARIQRKYLEPVMGRVKKVMPDEDDGVTEEDADRLEEEILSDVEYISKDEIEVNYNKEELYPAYEQNERPFA